MAAPSRPRVFLDVNIGEEPAGRLTIELFTDQTPKTAEHFRKLCTGEHNGLSYAKVPFHRIVDEYIIQAGDIQRGDGTGTTSIYHNGKPFEDENLDWREMDAAGLVVSANRGRDTNDSQFFITLEPCPNLNGKHTIFGRLVSGEDVIRRIAQVAVDKDDRPAIPVLMSRCGELERRKKESLKRDSIHETAQNDSDERGRRRKSDSSDDEMDTTPPKPGRRSRRQSDNFVDEVGRGRPRLRSVSRSPSDEAIKEESEDENSNLDHSPVRKHKRKRSQSPSRHVDRRSDEATFERRRRSLPNQYNDRHGRDPPDGDRYRPSPGREDDRYNASRRRRDNDGYRPSRDRYPNDGRLGGGGYDDDNIPPVKFKGRGVMKYREQREPGRL